MDVWNNKNSFVQQFGDRFYVIVTLRLPWLRFYRACSSVVRQMPGYDSQRRGTARTLPKFLCCSIYCLFCVVLRIVWVCVLYYCHRLATQLQLRNISYETIVQLKLCNTYKQLCFRFCEVSRHYYYYYYYYYCYYYYYYYFSCHRPILPGNSFEPTVIPTA